MDRNALSPFQQEALSQLQALTNGGDAEVAMSVLDSVGWDVQRAADIVFDGKPSAPLSFSQTNTPASSTAEGSRHVEDFDVDDSEQAGLLDGRPTGRQFDRVTPSTSALALLYRPIRFILALLAVPYTIIRAILRALRIPLPLPAVSPAFSITGLGLNFGLPHRPSVGPAPVRDAKVAAERWVQALEEETGCVSISRAQASGGDASGVASGSSSVTRRTGEAQTRVLPDFYLGSYENFVRTLAKETEAKVGCVIILSEEHDDTPEFKRSTLTDPEFVGLMKENDFLVWGGDIRDRDAWSAAQKLQATTYPFVAFIALQSRRMNAQSSQSSVLTILSRHQGPSIPASSAPTSAHTLVAHLKETLIPRVSPYLSGIRRQAADRETARLAEQRARERERAIRAEQDRAFEESARRDKERIERKIAEEKEEQRAALRQAEEEQRALEEQQRLEAEKAAWEAKRMEWRRWGRRTLLPREPRPGEQGRGKTVRVGVRMPNGKRPVRFFGENDSLTAVYAFVDAQFIPEGKEYTSESDPTVAPGGEEQGEIGLLHAMEKVGKKNGHWWGFKLAMAYPRREIHWEPGKKVGEVEGLSGGQLVVEMFEDPSTSRSKSRSRSSLESSRPGSSSATSPTSGGDSDEYETESD
ncbi:hypothetical protein BDY19DRAFT_968236 [Irpex rosettiformis]|uniref:Uncharacterized protein n=1 Tax=Irpex rosettiformis TaxID=378272 RepID=A0ACB8TSY0_9APHY|nr:hypothetical protein BDY19DRAFT_968236 [Irpex rosettiformis]